MHGLGWGHWLGEPAGAPASGVEGIWCWGGQVWGRQAVCSLGAVVPVVVDVDSSCDATDNEWDPSSDQIEPGKEWVWGVRERRSKGEEPGAQNP